MFPGFNEQIFFNLDQKVHKEKLESILDRSIELFRNYGIRVISMDDIARETGVSKKTIYQFVDNKPDLIRKCLDHSMQKFQCWMDDLDKRRLNAIEELLEISKRVNDEHEKFSPSNLFEMKKYYPEIFREHINEEKNLIYHYCKQNLENGISEKLYREDLDVELISQLYIQKISAIHDGDFLSQANFSFGRIFEVMFENHIRGIANKSGIKYFEKRKEQLNFNQ